MPIRTDQLLTITGGEDAFTVTAESLTEQVLPVTYVQQKLPKWCWAACGSMVLSRFGVTESQCQIASDSLSEQCCSEPLPSPCDRTIDLEGAAPTISDMYAARGVQFSPAGGQISETRLIEEIQSGRPVQVFYDITSGGIGIASQHTAIVVGIREDGAVIKFRVYDPHPSIGKGWCTHEWITTAGGRGSWMETLRQMRRD